MRPTPQRQWTLLVITQNNDQHKTSLGNEQGWGEVDSIKHCEKRLPLKGRSFRERSNFPRI